MFYDNDKIKCKQSELRLAITRLKEAIQKWDDPGAKYKCEKKLYLLKGGLENFVLTYPTSVVNPHKARHPPAHAIKKSKGNKRVDEMAKTIEYPDLDAAFIASPSPGKGTVLTAESSIKSQTTSAIEITSIKPGNRYYIIDQFQQLLNFILTQCWYL